MNEQDKVIVENAEVILDLWAKTKKHIEKTFKTKVHDDWDVHFQSLRLFINLNQYDMLRAKLLEIAAIMPQIAQKPEIAISKVKRVLQ